MNCIVCQGEEEGTGPWDPGVTRQDFHQDRAELEDLEHPARRQANVADLQQMAEMSCAVRTHTEVDWAPSASVIVSTPWETALGPTNKKLP